MCTFWVLQIIYKSYIKMLYNNCTRRSHKTFFISGGLEIRRNENHQETTLPHALPTVFFLKTIAFFFLILFLLHCHQEAFLRFFSRKSWIWAEIKFRRTFEAILELHSDLLESCVFFSSFRFAFFFLWNFYFLEDISKLLQLFPSYQILHVNTN